MNIFWHYIVALGSSLLLIPLNVWCGFCIALERGWADTSGTVCVARIKIRVRSMNNSVTALLIMNSVILFNLIKTGHNVFFFFLPLPCPECVLSLTLKITLGQPSVLGTLKSIVKLKEMPYILMCYWSVPLHTVLFFFQISFKNHSISLPPVIKLLVANCLQGLIPQGLLLK